MKSFLLFTSCIAATIAAPTTWTPELAALYSETSLHILSARANGLNDLGQCDLSKVNIIDYLSTINSTIAVKPPGDKNKLVQVTIGRGIQNYTCADNKASTKPTAIGAIANLYNVSCIAVHYPELLTLVTPFSVQFNTTLDAKGKLFYTNIERSGHHFFNSAGAPVFDLNDEKNNKLGVITANGKSPAMKVDAPSTAVRGQVVAANGLNGAVPWLKLESQAGTTENLSLVYRVDTAGGQAPQNCAGQPVAPAVISVQYAAQYWFFKSI